jgi:hypothetical protein
MTQHNEQIMVNVRTELGTFPSPVQSNFDRAKEALTGRLADDKLDNWAQLGLAISKRTVRSWEAGAELFNASPRVQRHLPAGQFISWVKIGDQLCTASPSLAVAFFRASPDAIERLRPRYIGDWAQSCRSLYRGTWKSSALACKLFEATPSLLESLSFDELRRFAEFLEEVSHRSYDMAGDALDKGSDLFPKLGRDAGAFIGLANTVAKHSWRHVQPMFDAAQHSLTEMPREQRTSFISLVNRLSTNDGIDSSRVMRDGARAVGGVGHEWRDTLIDLTHRIVSEGSPEASSAFLTTAPRVLERVTFPQLMEWHARGIQLVVEKPDAAEAYFKNESVLSHEMLDGLSSSVELDRVREIIRMYCRMLAGQEIEVQAAQQLVDKNIGWFQGELPTTEGTTIYLPKVINRHPSKDRNFAFFKVISTHQTGHIEFGSFQFSFERPSTMFSDLRAELTKSNGSALEAVPPEIEEKPVVDDVASSNGAAADEHVPIPMSRFFDLFPDRKISNDVFTIFESTRVDSKVMGAYRGLAVTFKAVQDDALESRPDMTELPAREALVEFMIRISLGQSANLIAPKRHLEVARKLRRLVRLMRNEDAIVEDAAEATIRACAWLAEIKNEEIDEDEFDNIDDDEEDDDPDGGDEEEQDLQGILQAFIESMQPGDGFGEDEESAEDSDDVDMGDEQDYSSPQEVDYRGEFKPELSQLLSQAQMMEGAEFADDDMGEMAPLTQEQLEQMMKNSAEVDIQEGQDGDEMSSELAEMLENLLKEMQRRDPQAQSQSSGPMQHVDEDGGPLTPTAADQFVYDEWDFRANEYRPRWCMVHEKEMSSGDAGFYRDTLAERASLLTMIKKQFELVMPEMYRKQKRLEDGEELDFDPMLEAVIDLRVGSTPDEKIYWRRNKTERSVAVAFLLDMSASTAEAIEEAKRPNDDWGAPDDPVEYMVWLRSRRTEGLRKSYKRIVDVEKEGVVLLINALETLGDDYGIYGFSGYGRENVEFYVIKDLDEKFTEEIPRRIDRIAPLHATRMGPSIRHATQKLANQDSRSRFLFLISDGRPQDRGYSREGVEKEYAVHDTRMALMEARREGIVPFCLTVDKQGHDYLKVMMDDFNYEVLPDVSLLPQRLLMLYKRLTT